MTFEFRKYTSMKYKCCLCNKDIPSKQKRLVDRKSAVRSLHYCLKCAMKRIKRERELYKEQEKIFLEVEKNYDKSSRQEKYKIIDKG